MTDDEGVVRETRTPADALTARRHRNERLYALLRAVREVPEPTSGVRVGLLSYNETRAYDAIVEMLDESAEALAAAEARNLTSFCAWCGEEHRHASLEARVENMLAHTVSCEKRPEKLLTEVLFGYEAMIRDLLEMVRRAAEAEDPDEWIRDGLALIDRVAPIAEKFASNASPEAKPTP